MRAFVDGVDGGLDGTTGPRLDPRRRVNPYVVSSWGPPRAYQTEPRWSRGLEPCRALTAHILTSLLVATALAQEPHPGFHPELRPKQLHIRDLAGNIHHTWQIPLEGWRFGELAKPMSYGRVMVMMVAPRISGANKRKVLAVLDWQGRIVWSYDPAPLGPVGAP